jgi:hypothetical protein
MVAVDLPISMRLGVARLLLLLPLLRRRLLPDS